MANILYFKLGKQVLINHQVNESFIVSALHKCSDYDQALDVFRALMGTIEDKNTKDIIKAPRLPTSVVKALENKTNSLHHADHLLKQALEELNNAIYGTKIDCRAITFNEWVAIHNVEHESYYDYLTCLADFVAVKAHEVANLKKVGD